jgi:predicted polyphosphate/ATP-dependent NAD kinase
MSNERGITLNEIRYAERLCQRTARLYRHVQSFGTWLTVVGGSGTLAALANNVPNWVPITGAIVFAAAGAALIAMRPADKAAMNEADAKRYAALRTRGLGLDDKALRAALEEARQSDVAEVEALRDVAWNDVVQEVGYADKRVLLSIPQRLLSAIA